MVEDAADTLFERSNPAGLILATRELNELFPKSQTFRRARC